TTSEVDAGSNSKHVCTCSFHRNVHALLTDTQHQLDLMLEIGRAGRIRDDRAVVHDRIGRLLEKEGQLALVAAHLSDVSRVVAPDAVDPADRRQPGAAFHRKRDPLGCWKEEFDLTHNGSSRNRSSLSWTTRSE